MVLWKIINQFDFVPVAAIMSIHFFIFNIMKSSLKSHGDMGAIDLPLGCKKKKNWNNYFLWCSAFIDWDHLLSAWNPDKQHDTVKWLQKALSTKIQASVLMQYPEIRYLFTFGSNGWMVWVDGEQEPMMSSPEVLNMKTVICIWGRSFFPVLFYGLLKFGTSGFCLVSRESLITFVHLCAELTLLTLLWCSLGTANKSAVFSFQSCDHSSAVYVQRCMWVQLGLFWCLTVNFSTS